MIIREVTQTSLRETDEKCKAFIDATSTVKLPVFWVDTTEAIIITPKNTSKIYVKYRKLIKHKKD